MTSTESLQRNEPTSASMDARPMYAARPWLAALTQCHRELIRFFRQRNRVFGALGQPIIFWVLFGAGLGSSFRLSEEAADLSYREYFFPGTLVLILLFTAIFSTISIIEDRREGFLQSVLVAPAPRWSMVLGKILGGSAIAMIEGMLFLILVFAVDMTFSWQIALGLVGMMALVAIGLTSLGFVIAWRMESTQGFHAIMSVFLMPMWLLSGAFFPAPKIDGASSLIDQGVYWIMQLNPLFYAVAGMRRILYWEQSSDLLPAGMPEFGTCLIVTVGFVLLTFAAAWKISSGRISADLL